MTEVNPDSDIDDHQTAQHEPTDIASAPDDQPIVPPPPTVNEVEAVHTGTADGHPSADREPDDANEDDAPAETVSLPGHKTAAGQVGSTAINHETTTEARPPEPKVPNSGTPVTTPAESAEDDNDEQIRNDNEHEPDETHATPHSEPDRGDDTTDSGGGADPGDQGHENDATNGAGEDNENANREDDNERAGNENDEEDNESPDPSSGNSGAGEANGGNDSPPGEDGGEDADGEQDDSGGQSAESYTGSDVPLAEVLTHPGPVSLDIPLDQGINLGAVTFHADFLQTHIDAAGLDHVNVTFASPEAGTLESTSASPGDLINNLQFSEPGDDELTAAGRNSGSNLEIVVNKNVFEGRVLAIATQGFERGMGEPADPQADQTVAWAQVMDVALRTGIRLARDANRTADRPRGDASTRATSSLLNAFGRRVVNYREPESPM